MNSLTLKGDNTMRNVEKGMYNIASEVSLFALTMLLFIPKPVFAQDLNIPEIHTTVAVQSESYFGEEDTILGYQIPDNRFTLRYVTIELEGRLGKYVEYNLEIGTASCVGPGIDVNIMEAGIFLKPFSFLKAGLMQGHVMRGFELYQECMDIITAEKPRFSKTFAPCHPTGAVMELDCNLTKTMGISAQLAYLNGLQKGTISEEHDMNIGLIFHTPIMGFSIGGFYTDMQQDFEYDDTLDMASRKGIGVDYNAFNIHLRGEYYLGKGFYSSYPDVNSEDMEMKAFFVEGAYQWKTGIKAIYYIQPYAMYQSWDKAYNVQGDQKYTYLTAGVTLSIGSPNTKLRVDYEIPIDFPEDTYEEADRLIIRIQSNI